MRAEAPAPPSLAMRQFLDWIAQQPRSYGEAMEAWRSSCPRLSVWEDALAEGLVAIECVPAGEVHAGGMRAARVTLTPVGREVLDRS